MGLIGSGMCLSDVTCHQPPAEHPSSRAATPAKLAPLLLARLWTDQTFTGKLIPNSPIAPRIRLLCWVS